METDLSEAASHGKNNVVALEARKKVLEAALQAKTEELRRLCVAEAELTGELPPETPLGPGEELPLFRRRVHTAFTLPNNLIEKIPSTQDESLLGLELEYEIQSRITSAALHLANDCSAKKAVRRQRRLIHQQSQRRLMELEARLNLVQQNMTHKSQKPRKKPRPPLETGFSKDASPDVECDPILQDDGVSLSPLGMPVESQASPSIHSYTFDPQWHQPGHDTGQCKPDMRNQSSLLLLLHYPHQQQQPQQQQQQPQQQQHRGPSVYTQTQPSPLNEQCGPQGLRMNHNVGHYYGENYPHGHLPHEYADGHSSFPKERLGYSQSEPIHWKKPESDQFVGKHHNNVSLHSVDKLKGETVQDVQKPNSGSGSFRHNRDRFGSLDRLKHAAYNGACVEFHSVDDLDVLQGGLEGPSTHTPVAFPPPKESAKGHTLPKASSNNEERVDFDRGDLLPEKEKTTERNHIDLHSALAPRSSHQLTLPVSTGSKGAGVPIEALLPGQTYPEHSLGQLASVSNERVLLRTQSLGSVETNYTNTRNTVGVSELHQVSQQSLQDSTLKKLKEKEWYETSLDTPSASHFPVTVSGQGSWKSLNTLKSEATANHRKVPQAMGNSVGGDDVDGRCHTNVDNSKSNWSPDLTFQQAKSGSDMEAFDTVVPFELPKNHMVIQAGKWQPYWEVTKPFEMSDFYKYSTKFRKNNSISCNNDSKSSKMPQNMMNTAPVSSASSHSPISRSHSSHQGSATNWEPKSPQDSGSAHSSPTKHPQQKSIYMPLQPLTCHPLDPPHQTPPGVNASCSGLSASPIHSVQHWNQSLVTSSMQMDSQGKDTGIHPKDDSLSAEMISWHPDQSVSHSATLV